MKPQNDLPPCDWEATRAAYLERFGPLFEGAPIAEEKGAPFWLLIFWNPVRPSAPVVYASFGAPTGDVFMTAAAPGLGLSQMVEDAARNAPPDLEPPAILEASARQTPFS